MIISDAGGPPGDQKRRGESVFEKINRMSVMKRHGGLSSDITLKNDLKATTSTTAFSRIARASVMAPKAIYSKAIGGTGDLKKTVGFDIAENDEDDAEKYRQDGEEAKDDQSNKGTNAGSFKSNKMKLVNLDFGLGSNSNEQEETFAHLDNFEETRIRGISKNIIFRKKTIASDVVILSAEKEEEQEKYEKKLSNPSRKPSKIESAASYNDKNSLDAEKEKSDPMGKRHLGMGGSAAGSAQVSSTDEYSHLTSQKKARCYQPIINFFTKIKQYCAEIYDGYNMSFTRVLIANEKTREVDLSKVKMSRIILPTSLFRQNWDLLILALIFYDLALIPLVIAFDVEQRIEITVMEFLILGLFVIDIFFNFKTGYLNSRGVLELNPARIISRYRRKYLLVDVISSMPVLLIFQFFYYSGIFSPDSQNDYSNLVYLYRLTRLSRLFRILSRFNENTKYNPALVRITKSVLLLIFLWHWIACFYWFIAERREFQENSWTPDPRYMTESLFQQYNYAILWAVTVTVGIGLEIHPKASSEVIFTTIVIIIGVVIYGILLGSTSSAFLALDDQVKTFSNLCNFI
jgi:hypothetical protein